jgi:hypothetical protein
VALNIIAAGELSPRASAVAGSVLRQVSAQSSPSYMRTTQIDYVVCTGQFYVQDFCSLGQDLVEMKKANMMV